MLSDEVRALPLWRGPFVGGTQRPSLPEVRTADEIGRHRATSVSHMSIDPGVPVALACVLLLAVTVTAYVVGGLPGPHTPVVAMLRAVGQLGVAALVITVVVRSLALSVLLLCAMFAVAVLTTTGRIGARGAWPWATVAMLSGLLPVVVVVLATGTVPPTGIALIPVVGIIAGNTMNGHSLVCRRAFAALREETGQYEAALSLGLDRSDAVAEVIHRRVPEALVPGLDQVRTAGVVTLPGAFIGVLLGGGTPAQAASAQVLVLVGIMAAQTVTAVVAERLVGRALLLPDDLRPVIRP